MIEWGGWSTQAPSEVRKIVGYGVSGWPNPGRGERIQRLEHAVVQLSDRLQAMESVMRRLLVEAGYRFEDTKPAGWTKD